MDMQLPSTTKKEREKQKKVWVYLPGSSDNDDPTCCLSAKAFHWEEFITRNGARNCCTNSAGGARTRRAIARSNQVKLGMLIEH